MIEIVFGLGKIKKSCYVQDFLLSLCKSYRKPMLKLF